MYKLLLCWRYLRTRYIALVSIISVMLGVATMIVTNAVMQGFTHEMQDRIHGILSDIVFESRSLDGVPDAEWHMKELDKVAGKYIAGMSPTVHVPAMLGFTVGDQYVTKQISLIGVDEATYSSVSDFGCYLQHPENRKKLNFELKEGGYDTGDHKAKDGSTISDNPQLRYAGWPLRRQKAKYAPRAVAPAGSLDGNPFAHSAAGQQAAAKDGNPIAPAAKEGTDFDPAREQHAGCVLGIAICNYQNGDGSNSFLTLPGDDVEITYPSAGKPPKPLSAKFTLVDFYESKTAEYDSNFAFVPIRKLQELRGMVDPATGVGSFNSIQIRLKPGTDLNKVRDLLQHHFDSRFYVVSTWRDKQGALLAAVWIETAILNILLFMIIAVAGFGILAIFLMIVVEKTRDIGILKSLGASGRGIMGIFLAYGLCLGIVGAGIGVILGFLVLRNINEIAEFVGGILGQRLFEVSVYGLPRIPTIVDPLTIILIVAGAMLIAVLASILPAWRAARLHPVEALRYE
jgi:lipoprotein-releasing system permease protein